MKIRRVRVYHQFQPFRRGSYAMHHGTAAGNDSYVVELECDDGVVGWGECAMLGAFYSEAFASGTAAGIIELAPHLVGLDACRPRAVQHHLDAIMRGQQYVKTAVDVAVWDAAARAAGRQLCDMLGGRVVDSIPVYNVVISGGNDAGAALLAERLVAEGYRRLQVKVGHDPVADARRLHEVRAAVGDDIVLYADANGGFTTGAAREFLRRTLDLDYTLEQPCASLDECIAVRDACAHPLVLDESIESVGDLLRAHRAGAVDGITIKLGRVGGPTTATLMRDLAIELGLQVSVESIGGAAINTAAYVHVAAGIPERLMGHTVDFPSWVTVDNATGLPAPTAGRQPLPSPTEPGLGVVVDRGALGEPLVDIGG